jgi:hypothetical protein
VEKKLKRPRGDVLVNRAWTAFGLWKMDIKMLRYQEVKTRDKRQRTCKIAKSMFNAPCSMLQKDRLRLMGKWALRYQDVKA